MIKIIRTINKMRILVKQISMSTRIINNNKFNSNNTNNITINKHLNNKIHFNKFNN